MKLKATHSSCPSPCPSAFVQRTKLYGLNEETCNCHIFVQDMWVPNIVSFIFELLLKKNKNKKKPLSLSNKVKIEDTK